VGILGSISRYLKACGHLLYTEPQAPDSSRWLRDKKALPLLATDLAQQLELQLAFDAFRHYALVQGPTEGDDPAHQRLVPRMRPAA